MGYRREKEGKYNMAEHSWKRNRFRAEWQSWICPHTNIDYITALTLDPKWRRKGNTTWRHIEEREQIQSRVTILDMSSYKHRLHHSSNMGSKMEKEGKYNMAAHSGKRNRFRAEWQSWICPHTNNDYITALTWDPGREKERQIQHGDA